MGPAQRCHPKGWWKTSATWDLSCLIRCSFLSTTWIAYIWILTHGKHPYSTSWPEWGDPNLILSSVICLLTRALEIVLYHPINDFIYELVLRWSTWRELFRTGFSLSAFSYSFICSNNSVQKTLVHIRIFSHGLHIMTILQLTRFNFDLLANNFLWFFILAE